MKRISDIDVFLLAVQLGSLSAAARACALTPAAVSYRLSHLEDRLGTRLLHRTTRRLTLTQDGAEYLRQAERVAPELRQLEATVSRRDTLPAGTLKVTAPASFGRQHIAPAIPKFLAMYPMIRLNFVMTDEVLDIIDHGFDVAIRIAKLTDSQFIVRRLANDKRVVCASPQYLAGREMPTVPSDLMMHNCLVLTQQPHWTLSGPKGKERIHVKGNFECNNGEVIRDAALAGVGIALKATWDVASALADGRLCRLLGNYSVVSEAAICAIYPSRKNVPAKTTLFISYLKDWLKAQPALFS